MGLSKRSVTLWTTDDEIEFLKTLPRNLHRKYLKTMHERGDWCGMDPLAIFKWLLVEEHTAYLATVKWGEVNP